MIIVPNQIRSSSDIDASRVGPKLYVGSMPPKGRALAQEGFDVLLLCAIELQPPREAFPGIEVIRVPLEDARPTQTEVDRALAGAALVADRVEVGKRILVTCAMGRNRSAFVAALALHVLTGEPGRKCGAHVRKMRIDPTGAPALSNEHFVRILRAL